MTAAQRIAAMRERAAQRRAVVRELEARYDRDREIRSGTAFVFQEAAQRGPGRLVER